MTLSMYQASVPMFVRQFKALSAIIEKGEAHAAATGLDPNAIFEARLAPDMLPFPKQIQIASDMAKGGIARLAGLTPPSWADDEADLPALRERLAKTIAYIESIPADQVDGSEEREIMLKAGPNELQFTGQDYLLGFVIPNVFFHLTTAYGLLRQKGVAIGKRDFLGA
ncbi:DUF1993 domain-containing protein [Sphingomonas sp. BIUV-7]|uniref:DUF1993 domain-containing protein n=1 Tax=Sphingomonas natans TaxID=3063330 RepID=A0ABT8Y4B4_9SPHN|nr:DUF1993 domain-containing protein [Sphingomonas sp. BIUV-7]MDO6413151.1 DUF1993 domain-containing protein [Sphingomonas sp. BIUV-7]